MDKFAKMQSSIANLSTTVSTNIVLNVSELTEDDDLHSLDESELDQGESEPEEPQHVPAHLRLINNVETRWNSTLAMFERVCKLKDSLMATIAILQQTRQTKIPSIDAEEIKIY